MLVLDANYIAGVERVLLNVSAAYRPKCRRIFLGENLTFSQGWQDWYLWHNLFRRRDNALQWGGGFYIDIGTNHPTQATNTLFFDKCLGWEGVCFEPQNKYQGMISRHRSCKLVPSCVLGSTQSVIFRGYGPAAKLIDVVSSAAPESAVEKEKHTGRKRCVVAAEALQSLGFHGRQIDLLSIDIEGAESSVLRCWPFEALHVHAILMETEKYGGEMLALNRFFHRHGYANVESFSTTMQGNRRAVLTDNLFVRQNPMPVYPGFRADSYEGRGSCPRGTGLTEHMHFWCAPFLTWEPESKLWGQCRNASSAQAGEASTGESAAAIAQERLNLQIKS